MMLFAICLAALVGTAAAVPTVVCLGDAATLKVTGATTNLLNGVPSINASSNLAVDGNSTSDFNAGSCYHSDFGDTSPVWYVDLGRTFQVYSVKIVNRGDCCGERLGNVTIDLTLGNPLGGSVGTVTNCGSINNATTGVDVTTLCGPVTTRPTHLWFEPNFPSGRYVRISKTEEFLTLCEVQVYVKSDNCMTVMRSNY